MRWPLGKVRVTSVNRPRRPPHALQSTPSRPVWQVHLATSAGVARTGISSASRRGGAGGVRSSDAAAAQVEPGSDPLAGNRDEPLAQSPLEEVLQKLAHGLRL